MDKKGKLDRQDQQGAQDHKAVLVNLVPKVNEEILETQEVLDQLESVDLLAPGDSLVHLVQRDQQGHQDKLAKVVSLVHLVLRASKAHKEKVAEEDRLALLDNKARLEALDQQVLVVPVVLLVHLVPKAS
jgi:hypothetical protein